MYFSKSRQARRTNAIRSKCRVNVRGLDRDDRGGGGIGLRHGNEYASINSEEKDCVVARPLSSEKKILAGHWDANPIHRPFSSQWWGLEEQFHSTSELSDSRLRYVDILPSGALGITEPGILIHIAGILTM